MQIVLTFDSLEELQAEIARLSDGKLKPKKPEAAPVEDVAKVIDKWEKEKSQPKQEQAPDQEPAPAPEPEKPAAVTEDFRVEVRHVLHELNKQKNSKTAATDIIKTFGVARLTDVPLSDLPELMKKAQEALNA